MFTIPSSRFFTHDNMQFNIKRRLSFYLLIVAMFTSLVAPVSGPPVRAANAPQPLTPINAVTITATGYGGSQATPPVAIPEFSWSAVPDTALYRLQLSQDIGFTTYIEYTTPLTRYTPTDVGRFNDGLWYWRVRVDAPIASDYSVALFFTRQWASPDNLPILNFPGDGATIEFYNAPSFSWSYVVGAGLYRFQISSAPEFSTLLYYADTLAPSHQPQLKLANGTYYWRVIPLDPLSREGTSSEVRTFYLGYNQIPTLLEPANNSLPTFTPTFRWTAQVGAQFYRLQYSTDPTFNANIVTVDTNNTTYTPINALPNDVNYYWRVSTFSGQSISDWSTVWSFRKQWYIQPVLLTPVNLYQYVRFPFFSWTPVPGASYYKIEIDDDIGFANPFFDFTSNLYYVPRTYSGDNYVRYWRITPYDRNNNAGKTSNVSSYISSSSFTSPVQIFPFYYYTPNNFPSPDQDVEMQPHGDYTSALPVFIWHRLTKPDPDGGTYAISYEVQVSSDPLFGTVDWTYDTETTSAAPTSDNDFTPDPDTTYYWRVRAQAEDHSWSQWSQIWKTKIDLSKGIAPTAAAAPQLIRPVNTAEIVETTPLLEWSPLLDAGSYEVQISKDENFTDIIDTHTVPYPAYAPQTSIAQRLLGWTDTYGTYYWRVRATGGTPPPGGWQWSDAWRFEIASQSEWSVGRTLGSVDNRLQVASDSPGDVADANYDLTNLYTVQDKDYWYFGFDANATSTNMVYALYLDQDNQDGVGATFDARGYSVTTISGHRPEFAIYVSQTGGTFSADQAAIYAWVGNGWGTPQTLASVGGDLYWDGSYLEIQVPNTAIGMQDTTGSYSLSLFSLLSSAGGPQDSVPADPNVPGNGEINYFTSVSEHLNLVMPPNNAGGDPKTFPFVPPFFWDYPTNSVTTAPWAGAKSEVHLDQQFTTKVGEFTITSNAPYYAPTSHDWTYDILGDNTYYWRVRPCYLGNCQYYGSWSQGWRFERQGFVPQNLLESVTFATPTFQWDLVEGAESYDLQVDNDPNFGSLDVNVNTSQNSFTPQYTLANSTYYWRVRTRRWGNVVNEWSSVKVFTLSLPQPTGLTPDDPSALSPVDRAPTLCWDALTADNTDGEAVLAAYKYRVQLSKGDPTFSAIYDWTDTEQICWTPTRGYDDGQYYWRVAMLDGQNRLGDYSEVATFTKQYPATTLISPVNQIITETPTFTWTRVDRASSYRLEISQFPSFYPIYDAATTNNTEYTPVFLYQSPMTYYWRVAIIDKDARIGPYTDATIILNPNTGSDFLYLPFILR